MIVVLSLTVSTSITCDKVDHSLLLSRSKKGGCREDVA